MHKIFDHRRHPHRLVLHAPIYIEPLTDRQPRQHNTMFVDPAIHRTQFRAEVEGVAVQDHDVVQHLDAEVYDGVERRGDRGRREGVQRGDGVVETAHKAGDG